MKKMKLNKCSDEEKRKEKITQPYGGGRGLGG